MPAQQPAAAGGGPETVEQCPRNQLATPERVPPLPGRARHHSGSLHQWERALAGVGTPEYDRKLRRALEEAEAVLVLNPLIAALVEPYARRVCVVPWGMDPARFPWPSPDELRGERSGECARYTVHGRVRANSSRGTMSPMRLVGCFANRGRISSWWSLRPAGTDR